LGTSTRRLRRFVSTYRLSIGMIAIALLLWGVTARAVWVDIDTKIKDREAALQEETEKTQKFLDAVLAKKDAERKAEEEAKAKEAAEAAKVAQENENQNVSSGSEASGLSSCNSSQTHNNPTSIDVLVNKKHCIQPLTFAPPDLVTSNGATLS